MYVCIYIYTYLYIYTYFISMYVYIYIYLREMAFLAIGRGHPLQHKTLELQQRHTPPPLQHTIPYGEQGSCEEPSPGHPLQHAPPSTATTHRLALQRQHTPPCTATGTATAKHTALKCNCAATATHTALHCNTYRLHCCCNTCAITATATHIPTTATHTLPGWRQ